MTWPEIVKNVFLLGIGGAGALTINYFKKRLAVLRWHAGHTLIAQAAPDAVFGDLKITFNGVDCASIYRTTIRIRNDSGKDLQNFEVSMRFRQGDIVVFENVWVEGTAWALAWADGFMQRVQATQAVRDNPEIGTLAERQLAFDLNRHRDYKVRALNRAATIAADFLVHTEQGQPYVEVMSDSAGIKVLPKPYIKPLRNEYWGIPAVQAAWTGIVLNIFLIAVLYQYVSEKGLMVAVAVVTTTLSLFMGVLAILTAKGVVGLFR